MAERTPSTEPTRPEGLFRHEALARLSSPERLDELTQIIRPRNWLAVLTCAALIGAALAWAVLARVPTMVTGSGVLMRPRQLVDVQVPASGCLETLAIRVGDVVTKGDVVGRIDQAELRQKLTEERAKLVALQQQDQDKSTLQRQQATLQMEHMLLEKASLQLQRQDLRKRLQDAEAQTTVLQQRVENRKRLESLGLIAKNGDELLQAQKALLENQDKIAEFTTTFKQQESQRKTLDTKSKSLSFQDLESTTARSNQIRELQSSIALTELQLEQNSQILSPYTGRVVELAVNPGQLVQRGARLGAIDQEDPAQKLVGLTYFPVKDGKKIRVGMPIQITPETVERARFGSILGTVTAVSPFAVTKEGLTSLVGNEEVVKRLLAQGPQIEVLAMLSEAPDTVSGYQWSSSRGPEVVISSGTTASGRVAVEQRAPMTYVVPSLRALGGL
jgi:HlyD family secretion protein